MLQPGRVELKNISGGVNKTCMVRCTVSDGKRR
jgi:excisionase family DNA binding protein